MARRRASEPRSFTPVLGKMAIFAFGPAISLLAPLVAMPAISSTFGADGWSSIATGQSLGMAIAVIVELGWGITGPVRAASGTLPDVSRLFRESVMERGLTLLVLVPVIAAIILVIGTAHPQVAILAAVSMSLNGLAASWLYVGLSKPLMMVLLDTLPRAGASLAGAWTLVAVGRNLELLPTIQILGGLIATLAPFAFLPQPSRRIGKRRSVGKVLKEFWRAQGAAMVVRVSTTAYVALPTVLLAIVGGQAAVASYAAVDRLARSGLSGLGSAGLAFQGWIPAVTGGARLSRMRVALWFNAALSIVSGTIFILLAPWLLKVLFLDRVETSQLEIWAFGVAIAFVVMSRCTGIQCLAVLGRTWYVAGSTATGFLISIPSILWAGHNWGASGVAVTIAAVECVVLVVQLFGLRRAMQIDSRIAEDDLQRPSPAMR